MEASTLSRLDVSQRARPAAAGPRGGQAISRPAAESDGVWPAPVQSTPLNIAVIDRDSGLLIVLAKRLERLGWKHRVLAETVPIKTIAAMRLDALVVDLGIMGPRCWDWLERLAQSRRSFGIVICTGSSTVAERVRALRLGADDWLSKPCHPEELIARVEAVAGHRRRVEPRNMETLKIGEVEIRRDQYQAFVADSSLNLTRREFQLIEHMAGAAGQVLERELIYERLWGYPMIRNDRSVDVFVHKLRRKLEAASPDWRYIHTHFGIGYSFAAESIAADTVESDELESRREASQDRLAA